MGADEWPLSRVTLSPSSGREDLDTALRDESRPSPRSAAASVLLRLIALLPGVPLLAGGGQWHSSQSDFACAIPGYSSAKTRSADVHLDHPTLPFDRNDPLLERVEQRLGIRQAHELELWRHLKSGTGRNAPSRRPDRRRLGAAIKDLPGPRVKQRACERSASPAESANAHAGPHAQPRGWPANAARVVARPANVHAGLPALHAGLHARAVTVPAVSGLGIAVPAVAPVAIPLPQPQPQLVP